MLRFALEPEGVVVELMGVGAHARTLAPLTLTADIEPAALPAHGRLLLDVFNRNAALSIRGDEAEESWRIVSWCSPPGPPTAFRWRNTRPALTALPVDSRPTAGSSPRSVGVTRGYDHHGTHRVQHDGMAHGPQLQLGKAAVSA